MKKSNIKFPLQNLLDGGIFLKPNFLDKKDFDTISNLIKEINYFPTYQPHLHY